MEKYYKQKDIGGTHYYKVSDDTVVHVNHLSEERGFLINNVQREGFEDLILGVFGVPEEISEENFEDALKTAIFELGLYKYVEPKS